MNTSCNKITKKDQFEIKKIALQALPTLPKRMKEDEKNAIYTYLPGRFKKYSVKNLYNHIKLWQAYPDDTFAMHQSRSAAKHAGSNIGIFKQEEEAAGLAEVVYAKATVSNIASSGQDSHQKKGASQARFYKVELSADQVNFINTAIENYITLVESTEGNDPRVNATEEYREAIDTLCDLRLIFGALAFDAS